MELTTTQQQAAGDSYTDNQQAIRNTAEQFARRYNLHGDDCIADASLHFLQAWTAWEGMGIKPCKWGTFLRNYIWNGLLDTYRIQARRAAKLPRVSESTLQQVAAPEEGEPYAEEVMGTLSADGQTVLELSLNPPGVVEQQAQARGGEGRNYRSVLRQYLHGIGWTAARVTESFREIKQAMR
jgi:DNA-directed RNA polymerase specialized sigma24 family protein